jgi:hypothetical protein
LEDFLNSLVSSLELNAFTAAVGVPKSPAAGGLGFAGGTERRTTSPSINDLVYGFHLLLVKGHKYWGFSYLMDFV